MKNTIKKILCAALALIMAIGAVPAFAVSFETELGNEIMWTVNEIGDGLGFTYGGAIFEGTNKINTEYDCFGFDAEKTGYYILSNVFSVSAEVVNDEPYYDATLVSLMDTDTVLVYLDEEKDVFVEAGNGDTIEIEYMGEGIADIDYDEKDFEDVIYMKEAFDSCVYIDGIQIEFTNGKKINHSGKTYLAFEDKELTNGVNTIKFLFTDYELEQTIEVYSIDYFVKNIELNNKEKYLASYKFMDREITFLSPYEWPDTFTVYYTDGTSETITDDFNQPAEITLPNGKKVEINAYYSHHYDGSVTLEISAAGYTFNTYECKTYNFGIIGMFVFMKNGLAFFVDGIKTVLK